jgi:hypothetical protein
MTNEEILLMMVSFPTVFMSVYMADRIWRKRAQWKRTCMMIRSVMNGEITRS